MLRFLFYQRLLNLKCAPDDRIALRLSKVERNMPKLGPDVLCLHFAIVDLRQGKAAGAIGIRIGESDALFYLGHIGYHVDEAFRGNGYAFRACKLCLPLLHKLGMTSVCITTDEDNLPSIRTCEKLECRLECAVEVPDWCRQSFDISHQKRRYILTLA